VAKLNNDTIGEADMLEFLKDYSDFSFEIQILNSLISKGFSCEHGGSYEDSITNKIREFDIRATKVFEKRYLRFAVECKNLRPNFPLLVCCLPRREDESFHEIVVSVDPDKCHLEEPSSSFDPPAMLAHSKNIRLSEKYSIYKFGDPVGKSCEQVGRTVKEITSSDAGVYEKWSQALSSAHDLTYLACRDGNDRTGDMALSLVFPVIVVPDGRLWTVQYDSEGNRKTAPKQAERCSYFVDRQFFHRGSLSGDELTISHFEFVTASGLLKFVDALCGDEDKLNASFPLDHIIDLLKNS